MTDQILDPFHRALFELINEEIATTKDKLASGGAGRISDDTASVAEKYAAAVSRIQALNDCLELCRQIETNQNSLGPRPSQVKVVQR
jgi:hypothetical protein